MASHAGIILCAGLPIRKAVNDTYIHSMSNFANIITSAKPEELTTETCSATVLVMLVLCVSRLYIPLMKDDAARIFVWSRRLCDSINLMTPGILRPVASLKCIMVYLYIVVM